MGIWEAPFKNHMTPLSLPIFSPGPPYSSHFLDDPPQYTHTDTKQKLTLTHDFTFLIFSIIPLLDVVVLTIAHCRNVRALGRVSYID